MIELTGIPSVLRAASVLYWLVALAALALVLWKVRPWWAMTGAAIAVAAAFGYVPVQDAIEANKRAAYAQEAWAYFKKKCDTAAGEKIYKTHSGVASVLIVKPLPPASDKDHFDQFWYGDPYSAPATSVRAELAASNLAWSDGPTSPTARGPGFDFVETWEPTGASEAAKRLFKYTYPRGAKNHQKEPIDRPVSRFGISWEDISTPEDRRLWVASSRLRVIDLSDNSLVAQRVGFYLESGLGSTGGQRRPWLASRGPNTTCPQVHEYSDRWFVLRVLNPDRGIRDGK